jgi:hypothetical protein
LRKSSRSTGKEEIAAAAGSACVPIGSLLSRGKEDVAGAAGTACVPLESLISGGEEEAPALVGSPCEGFKVLVSKEDDQATTPAGSACEPLESLVGKGDKEATAPAGSANEPVAAADAALAEKLMRSPMATPDIVTVMSTNQLSPTGPAGDLCNPSCSNKHRKEERTACPAHGMMAAAAGEALELDSCRTAGPEIRSVTTHSEATAAATAENGAWDPFVSTEEEEVEVATGTLCNSLAVVPAARGGPVVNSCAAFSQADDVQMSVNLLAATDDEPWVAFVSLDEEAAAPTTLQPHIIAAPAAAVTGKTEALSTKPFHLQALKIQSEPYDAAAGADMLLPISACIDNEIAAAATAGSAHDVLSAAASAGGTSIMLVETSAHAAEAVTTGRAAPAGGLTGGEPAAGTAGPSMALAHRDMPTSKSRTTPAAQPAVQARAKLIEPLLGPACSTALSLKPGNRLRSSQEVGPAGAAQQTQDATAAANQQGLNVSARGNTRGLTATAAASATIARQVSIRRVSVSGREGSRTSSAVPVLLDPAVAWRSLTSHKAAPAAPGGGRRSQRTSSACEASGVAVGDGYNPKGAATAGIRAARRATNFTAARSATKSGVRDDVLRSGLGSPVTGSTKTSSSVTAKQASKVQALIDVYSVKMGQYASNIDTSAAHLRPQELNTRIFKRATAGVAPSPAAVRAVAAAASPAPSSTTPPAAAAAPLGSARGTERMACTSRPTHFARPRGCNNTAGGHRMKSKMSPAVDASTGPAASREATLSCQGSSSNLVAAAAFTAATVAGTATTADSLSSLYSTGLASAGGSSFAGGEGGGGVGESTGTAGGLFLNRLSLVQQTTGLGFQGLGRSLGRLWDSGLVRENRLLFTTPLDLW